MERQHGSDPLGIAIRNSVQLVLSLGLRFYDLGRVLCPWMHEYQTPALAPALLMHACRNTRQTSHSPSLPLGPDSIPVGAHASLLKPIPLVVSPIILRRQLVGIFLAFCLLDTLELVVNVAVDRVIRVIFRLRQADVRVVFLVNGPSAARCLRGDIFVTVSLAAGLLAPVAPSANGPSACHGARWPARPADMAQRLASLTSEDVVEVVCRGGGRRAWRLRQTTVHTAKD